MHVKKQFGQHFLRDKRILGRIARAANLSRRDAVLEIGPGTGTLTEILASRAKAVIAIEKDRDLIPILKEKFVKIPHVLIIQGDALLADPRTYGLKDRSYTIVANIPYYITGRLLRLMFAKWPKPKLAVLMLQKEVAERILAKPPHMNLLSLSVQYWAEPAIVGRVSKNAFSPRPKVDSAMLRLVPRKGVNTQASRRFSETIRLGFSHPRKLLVKNLSARHPKDKLLGVFILLGVPHSARASELSLKEWLRLARALEQ